MKRKVAMAAMPDHSEFTYTLIRGGNIYTNVSLLEKL